MEWTPEYSDLGKLNEKNRINTRWHFLVLDFGFFLLETSTNNFLLSMGFAILKRGDWNHLVALKLVHNSWSIYIDLSSNYCNNGAELKGLHRVWQLREVVLGYHLEWELSGKVVSHYTDKSKESEKQKPIWQVPSKEVALIFDGATKIGIWTKTEEPDVVLGDKVYQPGRRSRTGGKEPMLRNWGPRGEKP
ncbi:hypothetical protein C2G38_2183598 [Gigaspora rosea]|uniref:Uncharacterized protein n=1 Tax=Gigaspora rosea TaxID=44941 RepID=A0A397VFZ1_9GLOM|nr:hypothetical protein C2G38_2183598 [Gigaspora rosea]